VAAAEEAAAVVEEADGRVRRSDADAKVARSGSLEQPWRRETGAIVTAAAAERESRQRENEANSREAMRRESESEVGHVKTYVGGDAPAGSPGRREQRRERVETTRGGEGWLVEAKIAECGMWVRR
jgi:hypothetical protein